MRGARSISVSMRFDLGCERYEHFVPRCGGRRGVHRRCRCGGSHRDTNCRGLLTWPQATLPAAAMKARVRWPVAFNAGCTVAGQRQGRAVDEEMRRVVEQLGAPVEGMPTFAPSARRTPARQSARPADRSTRGASVPTASIRETGRSSRDPRSRASASARSAAHRGVDLGRRARPARDPGRRNVPASRARREGNREMRRRVVGRARRAKSDRVGRAGVDAQRRRAHSGRQVEHVARRQHFRSLEV